jgi:hypothetical protein
MMACLTRPSRDVPLPTRATSSPLLSRFASIQRGSSVHHQCRARAQRALRRSTRSEKCAHTRDGLFLVAAMTSRGLKMALFAALRKKNREKSRKIGRNTLFDLDEWLLFIE